MRNQTRQRRIPGGREGTTTSSHPIHARADCLTYIHIFITSTLVTANAHFNHISCRSRVNYGGEEFVPGGPVQKLFAGHPIVDHSKQYN